ncbi:right-handed parallel beta-helix repeat-containing protein [Reichenbachiella sp. MALMAid0571]|uniref:right-handed parallel beta-helix repeat-containing protein n=1 Tax=Reichenbachiella sp. MALMAid0571 TaxID=3143939 RepID=UPI0032DEDEDD
MLRSFYFIFILFLILAFGCSAPPNPYNIYVSSGGLNSNDGSINKPIASLHQAIKMSRNIKKDQPINIWLANGIHRITEPLTLGTSDSLLNFRAVPNEKPVISGGMVISKWTKETNGLYSAQLTKDAPDEIRELFINKQRAIRARHPNNNYLRIAKAGEDKRTNFFFAEGDFPKVKNHESIELILLHDWSISRISVKSIDWDHNQLTTVDWIGTKVLDFFNLTHWEEQPRYFLENAIEFLDTPGEWYYDQTERKIFYYPNPNEAPEDIKAVIPVASQLVTISGNSKTRQKASKITFQGITFEYTAWQIPKEGYCGIQACMFDNRQADNNSWNWVPAAIELDLSSNCQFSNCVIRHVGGSAIWFRENTDNCTLTESHIYDVSGNGVNIGEGQKRKTDKNGEFWWQVTPEEATHNFTVSNSLIEQCGQQFYGAVGIWGGLIANTTIERNEIRNMPYTGVSLGWMWSPQPTPCRENTITGNHIHHILNKLSDGGGIYTLGLQPESVISNNLIHDVTVNAGRAESNGMFLDEGVTGVVVENNIVYNIAKSPLRFHRATTNIVRNNIFVCNDGVPHIQYNRTNEDDIQKIDNRILENSNTKELNAILDRRKSEFGLKKIIDQASQRL